MVVSGQDWEGEFFNAFAKIILFFKRADNGFMNNIIHNSSRTINIDH